MENKIYVNLKRKIQGDAGTFGNLFIAGFSCLTAELPWRDNIKSISCIPVGEYDCEIRNSRKFGKTYWVRNVQGRSYVLIHSGNYAGDKSLGYRSHIEGCILLGRYIGILQGQKAILSSRVTVNAFMRHMNNEPFKLTITENF